MNCTLNASEEGKNFSRSLIGIIQPVALTALFASSLVLNSLVIGVLRTMNQHGSHTTISNRFMLNLALSNIMLSMTATPLAVALVLQTNATFNQTIHWIGGFLATMSSAASIFSLVLVFADRYVAVCRPLHYTRRVTSTKAWGVIGLTWVLACLTAGVPRVTIFVLTESASTLRHTSSQDNHSHHTSSWQAPQDLIHPTITIGDDAMTYFTLRLILNLFFVAVCFALPLIILVYVNVTVIRAARRTTALARRNSSTSISGVKDVREAFMTRTSLTKDTRVTRYSLKSLCTALPSTAYSHQLTRPLTNRSSSSSLADSHCSSCCPKVVFRKEDWRAAKKGAIAIGTFVGCWFPFFTLVTLDAFCTGPVVELCKVSPLGCVIDNNRGRNRCGTVESCVLLCALFSCAINPFVYVLRLGSVRRGLVTCVYAKRRPKENRSTWTGRKLAGAVGNQ